MFKYMSGGGGGGGGGEEQIDYCWVEGGGGILFVYCPEGGTSAIIVIPRGVQLNYGITHCILSNWPFS